jgi:uncharacterized membrane protein
MTTNPSADPPPPGSPNDHVRPAETAFRQVWHKIRNRLLEGLLVILPLVVTIWVIRWLYTNLEYYVIDPLAVLVLWKARQLQRAPELPYWFETFVAPIIAIFIALVILYCCGALAHSRLRRAIDRALLRVPLVSTIYDAVLGVLQCLDKSKGQPSPQRVVLVAFPHPGMRLPAIVTATSKDIRTGKTLLCLYAPTAPIPGSGFFLMVPEEDAIELNWGIQQTLQAILSGGLTAPPDVTYYGNKLTAAAPAAAAPSVGQVASPDGKGEG